MKIKYDKEEFMSLQTLGFKLVELIETTVKLHYSDIEKKRQYNLDLAAHKNAQLVVPKDDEDDNDSNSDGDSIWEEEDSEASPEDIHDNQLFDLMPDSKGSITKPLKQEKGRRVAEELFNEWLINFDQEGEQPDRGSMVDELNKSMRGKHVYNYLKSEHDKGRDLTLVVRSIYPDQVSDKVVRHVTENFVQVTSILFPELADFMKYPNPLTKEEI